MKTRSKLNARILLAAVLACLAQPATADSILRPEQGSLPLYESTFTPVSVFETEWCYEPEHVAQGYVNTNYAYVSLPFAGIQAFGLSEYPCKKTPKGIVDFLNQFRKTNASLQFNDIGLKADTLEATMTYSNPRFAPTATKPPLLASGSDRFDVKLRLKVTSCDNEPVSIEPKVAQSIDDVIESLRGFETKNFLLCTLEQVTDPVVGEWLQPLGMHPRIKQDRFSPPRLESLAEDVGRLYIQSLIARRGGDIAIPHPHRRVNLVTQESWWDPSTLHHVNVSPHVVYLKNARPSGAADSIAAKQVTSRAVELMRDYGDGLMLVKDKSQAAKRLYTSQFMSRDGRELKEALESLRSRIPSLDIVDLISINVSIQRAYGYVRFLEGKIAGEYSMDSVIRSYGN